MSADPYRVIPLDVPTVRGDAWLRGAGAALVGALGLYLLFAGFGGKAMAWGGLGLLVTLLWIARVRKARAQVRRRGEHFLALEASGLRIGLGEAPPVELAWSQVADVDVDEDRLEVVVALRGDEAPVYVEPIYGGLSVYDLGAAVRAAFDAAPTGGGRGGVSEPDPNL